MHKPLSSHKMLGNTVVLLLVKGRIQYWEMIYDWKLGRMFINIHMSCVFTPRSYYFINMKFLHGTQLSLTFPLWAKLKISWFRNFSLQVWEWTFPALCNNVSAKAHVTWFWYPAWGCGGIKEKTSMHVHTRRSWNQDGVSYHYQPGPQHVYYIWSQGWLDSVVSVSGQALTVDIWEEEARAASLYILINFS